MNRPHPPTAFTRTGLFERVRKTDVRRAKRLAAAMAAFFLALFIIPGRLGIRWNASPSLPVGFYIESERTIWSCRVLSLRICRPLRGNPRLPKRRKLPGWRYAAHEACRREIWRHR